ncbi:hypothetical protein OH76DRAFT_1234828 [Lentinus brumalis]|uniref:Uncharacterized protein n=1 Tax=Lentinus brumalis TaxID=2498619 RepID=A0A371CSN9_9APHY|nr:hypothetical protein OH76DRAFT_1234828 [Polyporus brumalis]
MHASRPRPRPVSSGHVSSGFDLVAFVCCRFTALHCSPRISPSTLCVTFATAFPSSFARGPHAPPPSCTTITCSSAREWTPRTPCSDVKEIDATMTVRSALDVEAIYRPHRA